VKVEAPLRLSYSIPLDLYPKSLACPAPSRPGRGALARSPRTLGRDAVDVLMSWGDRHWGGRRSRVVLAPRRWRQVRDDASHHTGDGGNKARSPGRARNKP